VFGSPRRGCSTETVIGQREAWVWITFKLHNHPMLMSDVPWPPTSWLSPTTRTSHPC